MRALLLCLTLAACGGGSDATDQPLSDAELMDEIMAEADRINSCEQVSDCEAKALNCGALYVDASADQAYLDDLLAEHAARNQGRDCSAACACGVLRCEENKCVTEPGDCQDVPEDGMTVCL